jgi:hypothetical protein
MASTLVDRAAQQIDDSIGVLTLSQLCDHILLWAHYADSHRGICLEFDVANANFERLCPVRYTNDCPRFDEVVETIGVHHLDRERTGLLANVAYKAATHELPRDAICYWTGRWLYSKSPNWSYEDEWRSVMPGPGLWSFPSHALTGVIIGAAQDDELAELRDTLQRRPPIGLYRAVRRQGVYGLDIVSIDVETLPGDAAVRKRKRLAANWFNELNDASGERSSPPRHLSQWIARPGSPPSQ